MTSNDPGVEAWREGNGGQLEPPAECSGIFFFF